MNSTASSLYPCQSVFIRGCLLLAPLLSAGCGSRAEQDDTLVAVSNGTLTVWSTYPGKLEARRVETMLCERFGTNDVRVLLVGHSYAGHALLRSLINDPAAEFKLLGNTYMWKVTRAPDGVFRVHYNDRSPAQAAAAEASR